MKYIDNSQFEKYANELALKYPVFALESAELAMNDMLDFHLGRIPEYPLETIGRLMPPDGVSWLRTDQQRKWFFAAVQSGELPGWRWVDADKWIYLENVDGETKKRVEIREPAHPEKIGGARTGNLGRAKGREVSKGNEEVIGQIGFDSSLAPYAPWVVGDDYPGSVIGGEQMYQARIHVDVWWQFGGIINENAEPGWIVFTRTFWEEFGKRINNG